MHLLLSDILARLKGFLLKHESVSDETRTANRESHFQQLEQISRLNSSLIRLRFSYFGLISKELSVAYGNADWIYLLSAMREAGLHTPLHEAIKEVIEEAFVFPEQRMSRGNLGAILFRYCEGNLSEIAADYLFLMDKTNEPLFAAIFANSDYESAFKAAVANLK